jgi:hypothetical protein
MFCTLYKYRDEENFEDAPHSNLETLRPCNLVWHRLLWHRHMSSSWAGLLLLSVAGRTNIRASGHGFTSATSKRIALRLPTGKVDTVCRPLIDDVGETSEYLVSMAVGVSTRTVVALALCWCCTLRHGRKVPA